MSIKSETGTRRIYLSAPHMSGGEKKYIDEAFEQNWIAPLGPNVDGFEKAVAAYCGVKDAAALSSGTAAIHLALIMLGVGSGDEVICSSFTFSGTVNPVSYQGATPVFVDSEEQSWNMDPELLEEAVKERIQKGKRVKAIIPVHLYGMPAHMEEILSIAEKYGILSVPQVVVCYFQMILSSPDRPGSWLPRQGTGLPITCTAISVIITA
jgi:dTDP-4-amino-4,6-dideoxygalactose transaminase